MTANIIWFCTAECLGLIFLIAGLYTKKLTTPGHFYSGSVVTLKDESRVKDYNKDLASIFITFAIPFLIAGVMNWWSPLISTVLLVLGSVGGGIIMVIRYHFLQKKYELDVK